MISRVHIILSALVMVCMGSVNAQVSRVDYSYVVKNPIFLDSTRTSYFGKEFEFTSTREYLADSIFTDTGLFSQDTSSTVAFKKQNGSWFIKTNKTWALFFNGNLKFSGVVKLYGLTFKTKWSKARITEHGNEYLLQLIPGPGISVSHMPKFIFSYSSGIVGIRTDEVTLIRKGY